MWCVCPHTMCSGPHDSQLLYSSCLCCLHLKYAVILRLCVSVRWRRWMPAVCSWLLSLWPASTQRCSSMTCAASRCHGNTAVPGAFLMANCSRANWPGLLVTGPPCWTCVRGRYEPECVCLCVIVWQHGDGQKWTEQEMIKGAPIKIFGANRRLLEVLSADTNENVYYHLKMLVISSLITPFKCWENK